MRRKCLSRHTVYHKLTLSIVNDTVAVTVCLLFVTCLLFTLTGFCLQRFVRFTFVLHLRQFPIAYWHAACCLANRHSTAANTFF